MSRTTTTLVLLTIAFAFSANSIMAGYGSQQDPIELQLKDADVRSVMRVFAEMTNSELYLDPAVMGTVTIGIEGISWMTALDAVCESVGCLWQLKGGTQRTLTILPGTKASDASGLNSPITITVEGVPILDLIGLVANRSGVSLERIGQPQGEISLAIDGASARTVISAVCESSGGCTWRTTEDGSIEVEATDSPKMTRAQV
ncbi:MAG: hypothetical protein GY906_00070, partial [bacterium]|nr:hypothetical protein [bacterium]